MVVFRVEVHLKVIKSAPKVLKPAHIRKFMGFLRELPENPIPEGHDIKPLTDVKIHGCDSYRLRLGDYRLLYAVDWDRKIVYVVRLDPREKAYKKR